MAFSKWICSKSTKNMFVKIVHPRGHVELHDRPIVAAEVINRNPRCVIAYPHVFRQPWAIVAPETVLMPGHKFYVVPVSTIRKLQRLSNKYSPSPVVPRRQTPTSKYPKRDDSFSTCCFFINKNKTPLSCINHNLDDEGGANGTDFKINARKGGSCFSQKNCFAFMITGVKKTHDTADATDDSEERTRSSVNFISPYQTWEQTMKRTRDHAKGSPKRHAAFDQWQPSLASISETEEYISF